MLMWTTAADRGRLRRASVRLVGAEVGELKIDADILTLQQRHDLLQGIPVLADDAHRIALDACLRLLL